MADRGSSGPKLPAFKIIPKIVFSVIVSVGWLVFLILWLFFFAGNHSVYRNLAVFLLSILILGIVGALTWIPFGIMGKRK
jgi:hypothetical protein